MQGGNQDRALRRYTNDTPMHAHLRGRVAELEKKHFVRLKPVTMNELIKCFGMGDRKRLRMALYGRLVECFQNHGTPVARLVWKTARRATQKTHPDRWFARVILDELRSADLLIEESES